MARVYAPGRVDADGNDIDLRNTTEQLTARGAPPAAIGDATFTDLPPRYDPETGELVEPIDLAPSKPAAGGVVRPGAAVRGAGRVRPATQLSYATADHNPPLSAGRIAVELFKPMNLVVMFFVALTHVLTELSVLFGFGGIISAGLVLLMTFALFGHYANVVEEIAVGGADELPRPFRDFRLGEDIWSPFCKMFGTIAVCYGPAIVCMYASPPGSLTQFVGTPVLALGGAMLFPALLLTVVTSGTWHNLRPDRVIGAAAACGSAYALSVVLGVIALVTYVTAISLSAGAVNSLMAAVGLSKLAFMMFIGNTALAVGLYLAHLFAWHLGTLYRRFQPNFPWILQHHVRTPRPTRAFPVAAPTERPR